MRHPQLWTAFLAALGLGLTACSMGRPPPLAAAGRSPEATPTAYQCGSQGNPCHAAAQLCELRGENCTPLQHPQLCLVGTPRCAGPAAPALIPVLHFFSGGPAS